MTSTIAVLLLVSVFPFVAWPLAQGRQDRARHRAAGRDQRAELREEVELDAATGRLSADEAHERLESL